jgi:molybdopterin-guanine dinucleotide biosynthesis protein
LIEVLVISGPAAVGKTSVTNELSAQLRAADIAHAVIDTDALDLRASRIGAVVDPASFRRRPAAAGEAVGV